MIEKTDRKSETEQEVIARAIAEVGDKLQWAELMTRKFLSPGTITSWDALASPPEVRKLYLGGEVTAESESMTSVEVLAENARRNASHMHDYYRNLHSCHPRVAELLRDIFMAAMLL